MGDVVELRPQQKTYGVIDVTREQPINTCIWAASPLTNASINTIKKVERACARNISHADSMALLRNIAANMRQALHEHEDIIDLLEDD